MLLGQFFVKNVKNNPRIIFERPKLDKFQKSENAEIVGNSIKEAFFHLQTPELGHFSRYLLEIVYTYTPDRVLSHIFRFYSENFLIF